MPSGMSDAETTGASTAGSGHGHDAPRRVLLVHLDHDRREALPDAVLQQPGLDQVEDHPLVAVRALRGLLHRPGQVGQRGVHPVGHLGAGAQGDADLRGVAVAEPAQRGGHVGVLGVEGAVQRLGRGLAVEGDVPAAAEQPGAGRDHRGVLRLGRRRGRG